MLKKQSSTLLHVYGWVDYLTFFLYLHVKNKSNNKKCCKSKCWLYLLIYIYHIMHHYHLLLE